LNIIANVVGSVEKYLGNKMVQAEAMDVMLAYEHKLKNNNDIVYYNNKTSLVLNYFTSNQNWKHA